MRNVNEDWAVKAIAKRMEQIDKALQIETNATVLSTLRNEYLELESKLATRISKINEANAAGRYHV